MHLCSPNPVEFGAPSLLQLELFMLLLSLGVAAALTLAAGGSAIFVHLRRRRASWNKIAADEEQEEEQAIGIAELHDSSRDDAPSPIRPRSLTPALYPPPTTPPIAKEHLFIPPRTLASPNGPDDAWPLVDLPSYRPEEASAAPAPLYAEGAAGRNESVGEKLESHGMLEALGEEFVTDDEGGIVRRDGGRGR